MGNKFIDTLTRNLDKNLFIAIHEGHEILQKIEGDKDLI